MSDDSNWWEWDANTKEWSYQKTENHVFAPYHKGGKRIGDMTRDELIEVIAVGYYEREILAKAFLFVLNGGDVSGVDLSSETITAQLIVNRLEGK